MTNFNKRFAFTLSELLLSLIIVGVVAIITVPVLINNVQKKLFATQVKNFVAQIEQLAQDEMISHRTRNLFDTDFASPLTLLTSKHFDIVKSCPVAVAHYQCWNGKDGKGYKKLDGTKDLYWRNYESIVLKNGMIVGYSLDGWGNTASNPVNQIVIDVNGYEPPNIWGRDYFTIQIDSKGHVMGRNAATKSNLTTSQIVLYCKTNSAAYCIDLLINNNWKMDY